MIWDPEKPKKNKQKTKTKFERKNKSHVTIFRLPLGGCPN
jgi:hypothetical protein